jgi:hypothetical protein
MWLDVPSQAVPVLRAVILMIAKTFAPETGVKPFMIMRTGHYTGLDDD